MAEEVAGPEQRFCEILLQEGLVDQAGLERARRAREELGGALDDILVKLGLIGEQDRARAHSIQHTVPLASKKDYPSTPLFADQVSPGFLAKSRILPLREDEEGVDLAMVDPGDDYAIRAMALLAGKPVRPWAGTAKEIEDALQELYGDGGSAMDRIIADAGSDGPDEAEEDLERLRDLASEAPVVRLVNSLFLRAYEQRASDIHIEPSERHLGVRLRVDGVLREVEPVPKRLAAAIVSRIKIMAHMDIAERRLSQDGRIRMRVRDQEIDMRVSTVPTLFGESMVLRLLEHGTVDLDFDALGIEPAILAHIEEALAGHHGILLVTGPTGSGKTTTLYTALKYLNSPERKIITVEDPIEYQLERVTQIQVNPDIGLTFANVLRSIVRQDPDVIMIGEMRDLETAEIAVQSALTGHLVLSTLHTNDAAGAITRLLDMGVEDYLLTSTVNGVLAQRLVRALCRECRQDWEAPPELVQRMQLRRFTGDEPVRLYRPGGCDACSGLGYRGRIGIFEFLPVDAAIRSLILQRSDSDTIQRAAVEQGMTTLFDDGLRKVLQGLTSIEEVLRVTRQH